VWAANRDFGVVERTHAARQEQSLATRPTLHQPCRCSHRFGAGLAV
jgi:hypothetical protein